MSGDHGHHHDHPLESITHVHGGAMVLDIGGKIGALHVLLDDDWVGRELFLASDDPSFNVHTGVWWRDAGDDHVATALFGALEAGRYHVLGRDGHRWREVDVLGGELAELDLRREASSLAGSRTRVSVAAQAAPGR